MEYTGNYDVSVEDFAHAAKLATRTRDTVLRVASALVMLAVLLIVGRSFIDFIQAAVESPGELKNFLLFESGRLGISVMSWAAVIVTVLLPAFIIFALRSLLEEIWPSRKLRRLLRDSDALGLTNYAVNDTRIRAQTANGPDVSMPWSSFDSLRHDATMAVLMRKKRMRFFVPLAAFRADPDAVLAHLASRIEAASQIGSPPSAE